MKPLLAFAGLIDRISDAFAVLAKWSVLLCAFISAGNAVVRYVFGYSSNGWLEIQWYLFAACVMLGGAQDPTQLSLNFRPVYQPPRSPGEAQRHRKEVRAPAAARGACALH